MFGNIAFRNNADVRAAIRVRCLDDDEWAAAEHGQRLGANAGWLFVVGDDKSTKEIAEELFISPTTVEKHRADIGASLRTVDGVVRNTYHNNPGKLAAWASASHVESPQRKRKKTPQNHQRYKGFKRNGLINDSRLG